MSADLHIHVLEGVTEEDLAIFNANVIGSKWFSPNMDDNPAMRERKDELFTIIGQTPQKWIGEVSWLKAALLGDDETYVPSTVGEIESLIGEDLPLLTDELADKILAAFDLPNATTYRLAEKSDVVDFLDRYKGKQLFTVSW